MIDRSILQYRTMDGDGSPHQLNKLMDAAVNVKITVEPLSSVTNASGKLFFYIYGRLLHCFIFLNNLTLFFLDNFYIVKDLKERHC